MIFEIISPNSVSLDEIVAILAMSLAPLIACAVFLICSTTILTASSIPFLINTGFAPAVTLRNPSFTSACERIIAVVVPSPESVFVLEDASYTSLLPMFSNSSAKTISLAMVTPSFVISGAVYSLSIATNLPFAPRVPFTQSATVFTPFWRAFFASSP